MYAVPSLPRALPAFTLREAAAQPQAAGPSTGWHTTLPLPVATVAPDKDRMRQQLLQVSQELEKAMCALGEAQLEKELLAAERTQIIVQLQALTAALSHGPSVLTSFDEAAASDAERRVQQLRAALPPHSGIRQLSQASELQPHIQGLHQHLTGMREASAREVAALEEEASSAVAEAARCKGEAERATAAAQDASAKEESYKGQVRALEERLQRQREEFDNKIRLMKDQVYSSQQDAEAARRKAEDATAQAERQAEQLGRQSEKMAQQVQEQAQQAERQAQELAERGAAEVAELSRRCEEQQRQLCQAQQRQQEQAAQQQRQLQEAEQRHAQQATTLQQRQQDQALWLQQQLQEALHDRLQAESGRGAEAERAVQVEQLLKRELQVAKDDNRRLQAVLMEAERQLLGVRDDVAGVKQRQVELKGKLIDQKQARDKALRRIAAGAGCATVPSQAQVLRISHEDEGHAAGTPSAGGPLDAHSLTAGLDQSIREVLQRLQGI